MFEVIDRLGLSEAILLGHSAYGIMALEVAKRFYPIIKAIIMARTPTESK
jgi:hypothetical protein